MKNSILIVDDSKPILRLLETILGKHYLVHSMSDGLDAMKWLSQGNKPDLIISDVQMPNISGWELAQHISGSALYDDIPVIILSATDVEENKSKCKLYGACDFVQKPFDPLILLEKVKAVLSSLPLKKKPLNATC